MSLLVSLMVMLVVMMGTSTILAQAEKSCIVGDKMSCGRSLVCVSAAGNEGDEGICARRCDVGVAQSCRTGMVCHPLGAKAEPGKGGCVKEDECFPEQVRLDRLQLAMVDHVVNAYDNILNNKYQALFRQYVQDVSQKVPRCGGEKQESCPSGSFCLRDPGRPNMKTPGYCFKSIPEWDRCEVGSSTGCSEGKICMASPGAKSGTCVPENSASCEFGTVNGCQEGFACSSLGEGNMGWCKEINPCDSFEDEMEYSMFWHFNGVNSIMAYDLDKEHREIVRTRILGKPTESKNNDNSDYTAIESEKVPQTALER